MDPVPTGGFTLLGSPTVVADITSPGSDSQIAARLFDVDTGTNTQTLVARGLWRPAITRHARSGRCSSCTRTATGSSTATW